MDDVIRNIRPEFVADGMDEAVLHEMQQLWETKIYQSGSLGQHQLPVSTETENFAHHNQNYNYAEPVLPGPYANNSYVPDHNAFPPIDVPHMYMPSQNFINPTEGRSQFPPSLPSNPLNAQALRSITTSNIDPSNLGRPLQFIPPPSLNTWINTTTSSTSNTTSNNNNNQVNLPDPHSRPSSSASIHKILHQHDGASDEDAVQQPSDKWTEAREIDALMVQKYTEKQNKQQKKKQKIRQVDGGDDEDEEGAADASPKDDEELDSDLDDEDDTEPETENYILCQYEKVTRIKAKRKTNLKDGIMHVNGKDSLFHKATGEFDW